ncbi:hypothetical protein EDD85DRAFT_78041 [Armillaria nabsnona]|nr:hypothetical protein EDD85DRAFT_78041 [Armillaria nabsnona]
MQPTSLVNMEGFIPVFDSDGRIKALVDPGRINQSSVPILQTTPEPAVPIVPCPLENGCYVPVKQNTAPDQTNSTHLKVSSQADAAPHPQLRTAETAATMKLKPNTKPLTKNEDHDFTRWQQPDLSDPAPLTVYHPVENSPQPDARRGIDNGIVFTSLEKIEGGWNGWPSGRFALDISAEDFHETKELMVHWSTKNNGGDIDGSKDSPTVNGGKISNKRCLGILRCDNTECAAGYRPQVTPHGRKQQLKGRCICGLELRYFDCGSRSYLIQWKGGYRYINGGPHNHSRFSYVLHMSRTEEAEFSELVESHPKLGPAALMLGPSRLNGYGRGAADISQATRHPDRVKYERRQVKARTMAESGAWYLTQFSNWQRNHPGVVRTYQNGSDITIISIQTTWMRDMLVSDIHNPHEDPLNGAHRILRLRLRGCVSVFTHAFVTSA